MHARKQRPKRGPQIRKGRTVPRTCVGPSGLRGTNKNLDDPALHWRLDGQWGYPSECSREPCPHLPKPELQAHKRHSGFVKGFGCRPMKVVPRTSGLASESLQERKPRLGNVERCGRRYGDLSAAGELSDLDRAHATSCSTVERLTSERRMVSNSMNCRTICGGVGSSSGFAMASSSCARDIAGAHAFGEQAVVADAVEAPWQHVDEQLWGTRQALRISLSDAASRRLRLPASAMPSSSPLSSVQVPENPIPTS